MGSDETARKLAKRIFMLNITYYAICMFPFYASMTEKTRSAGEAFIVTILLIFALAVLFIVIYKIHLNSCKVGTVFLMISFLTILGFFYGFFVEEGEIEDLDGQLELLGRAFILMIILNALIVLIISIAFIASFLN